MTEISHEPPRVPHPGWLKLQQLKAEQRGAVIRFLRNNPLSTSEEIYKATGSGPACASGLIKAPIHNGQRVFRLNHQALKAEGLE